MNGAESVARTLLSHGIDVTFANPGTSEMHFVAALDRLPAMRCVPCLFEGVATGAADGYFRIARRPAATLLHLGPGLANGLANLHNARRARSALVNVVGEHATFHRAASSPLASDVPAVARTFSDWVAMAETAADAGRLTAEAVAQATPGRIATLLLPADSAWGEADGPASRRPMPGLAPAAPATIEAAARMLRAGTPTLLLLGGTALHADGLAAAARIAAATGADLRAELLNARIDRGPDVPTVARLPFGIDAAIAFLGQYAQIVLVGADRPAAFFAYPGRPSLLASQDAVITTLSEPAEDALPALAALAAELQAHRPPTFARVEAAGSGPAAAAGAILAAELPEGAIVVDEAVTLGEVFYTGTAHAPAHTWLQLTGGSIGIGLPLAAGAAIAAPDRRVVVLQADGSAMFTVQALWTHARERLDITTIILSNRAYAILLGEMTRLTPEISARARDMLELQRPSIDWVGLAASLGVEGCRVEEPDGFRSALRAAFASRGPRLIELRL